MNKRSLNTIGTYMGKTLHVANENKIYISRPNIVVYTAAGPVYKSKAIKLLLITEKI
jgi:hypothetical protein